ncbi:PA14 domain-containing protein [Paenibacillus sp. N3.4]|uniref:PA14 domain-containing protein n=1 Tax=Paenibacillus sp. N3.4 TaxID=2603222 RepID=UPI0011CBE1DC|nr:PA14 domain-containing protein [Paenibacillus sp. N3.4]TXK84476.1 hypothetical protein FU659_08645 [Paenibacillus sp. N3.4]
MKLKKMAGFAAAALFLCAAALLVLPKVSNAANTNLAYNRPIVATSEITTGHSAKIANDGNQDTYFESAYTLPQSLTVDLGYTYAVNKVVMKLPTTSNWTDRTMTIAVQGSTDNVTFSDIVASTAYSFRLSTGNTVEVNFTTTGARYIRLLYTANTARTAAQLGELEVYTDSNAPDLTVADLSWTPANPQEGDQVTFSATVKNIGNTTIPSGVGHIVDFKIDGTTVATTLPYQTALAAGATATLTANSTWTAERYQFDIQAIANASGTVGESNGLNNDDFTKQLIVKGSGWQNNFNVKEELGIYSFSEELIGYKLDFTGQQATPDHIRLRQYGRSTPLAYQLSDVKLDGSGYLTGATIHFRANLQIGDSNRYVIDTDSAYTPDFADEVTLTDNGDGTATIAGNEQRLKVPYGSLLKNNVSLTSVEAPLIGISREAGSWLGNGSFTAPSTVTVSKVYGRIVEQGPLFIKYKVTYTVNNNRQYDVELTVRHNEKYVTVDESNSGFLSSDNVFLRFSYKNGIDPNGRIVMQNGGYIRSSSGGYSGNYSDNINSSGKLPYELGIYTPNSIGIMRSTSFWNDSGSDAILFAAYRLKDWKTETRQYYSAFVKQNLRFYQTSIDKYMEAGIEGTERHWALSVIPRSEMVMSGKRMSDYTVPPAVTIDSAWTAIPTAANLQPGTAPDVKLWQKLTDFSLNGYKEMVFDFPEDTRQTLTLPGQTNTVLANPNLYWTPVYCGSCFNVYYWLSDKYWDVSSELGGPGWLGRNQRALISDYAFNRGSWDINDRKRTRSLLIFTAYTAAEDNSLPHTSMLGGHANFNLDIKQILALAAGAFPNHPHAESWKTEFIKDYNELLNYFTRQDDKVLNAKGGRWYENLPTYASASVDAMMAAHASLLKYDNTDIFTNGNFKSLVQWMMNALVPNERLSFRMPVPIGAHSNNIAPRNEFDGIYKTLANEVSLSDSALGSQLLWSATNGAEGTKPAYESTLYTDFGPVMRYDFGGDNEAFLYLQQLNGNGYRWSPNANGAIYYAAKGKRFSWNGGEESGDAFDLNKLPLYQVNGKALGAHPVDGVLYNFGFGQYYKALANAGNAPYLSRGVLMIRNDYIGIYDDLSNTTSDGTFQWVNREMGLKAQYYNNSDFTDLRATEIDSTRFPGSGSWGTAVPNPSLDPDTYSVVWTGEILPKYSQAYTFSVSVAAGDKAKIYVNNVLVVDTSAGTTSPVTLTASQFYDIRIEYAHNTGSASLKWNWSSASQPNATVEGTFYLFHELDQTPNIYTVKEGPGDELHIVSPGVLSVTNAVYGAIINGNEYLFASDTTQNVDSGSVVFQGKVGYAKAQQVALFEGTKIGYNDLVLEKSNGDFGASAEVIDASTVKGRIAGSSGGTMTITLPAAFSTSGIAVKVNDSTVSHTLSGNKVTFHAAIVQSEGTKTFTITTAPPLFSDNFEDGDSNGWETTNGTWNVTVDGSNVYRSLTGGSSVAGSTSWTDYTVRASIKMTGAPTATADVLGRYTDGNNFYFLQLDGVGNRLKLYKKVAGTVTLLQSATLTVASGQWYNVQLSFSGSVITGAVDGTALISATDTSLIAGKIGLRASAEANYDDIVVY